MKNLFLMTIFMAIQAFCKEMQEILEGITPIVILNQNNFNGMVNPGDTGDWFVMFYSPACSHCKEAMPAWEEFAKLQYGKVNVGVVNGFDITIFPTFYFFAGNKMYHYDGPRNVEYWTKFVTEEYKKQTALEVPAAGKDVGQGLKHFWNIFYQLKYLFEHKPLILAAFIAMAILTTALTIWCTSWLSDRMDHINEEEEAEKNKDEVETGKVKPHRD